MAKHELHDRAIDMRKLGMSYTQIKAELGVSKSALSGWLHGYPLPPERLKELRTKSERQIERIRETKARKKEIRLQDVYARAAKRIDILSAREFFMAGILLYWAEGTKAAPSVVCLTNTDPTMLMFFLQWLEAEGVQRARLRVKLHLYADMDIEKETKYWIDVLGLPKSSFCKPYIKKSFFNKRRNYKGRFGHGTCNLIYNNRDMYEFIMASIRYLGETRGTNGFLKIRRV